MMPSKRREARENSRQRRETAQASTIYRASINIDFTSPNTAEYQKLIKALIALKWVYVETSALCIQGKLEDVLKSLEIIGKQCRDSGVLSALTLHVQGTRDFNGKPYKSVITPQDALQEIKRKPLP